MSKIKLNFQQLMERCRAPQHDFFKEGDLFELPDAGMREAWYVYKDNGAKILAVAHLDTVVQISENWTFQTARLGANNRKLTYLWNAQLDDRLGAYIILDLLPELMGGFKYDVLLTTNEETGGTTAKDFVLPEGKEYNWIFEFDRRGMGAVLYDYEDKDWRATVSQYFNVMQGSFSDISRLQHLGVKAMNVGTGYYDEHRDSCHMIVQETQAQVNHFLGFFDEYADTHFPHTVKARTYNYGYNRYGWDDEDYGEYGRWQDGTWRPATGSAATSTTSHNRSNNPNNAYNNQASKSASSPEAKDWILIPQVEHFRMKMIGSEIPVEIFVHPITGQQAVLCTVCNEPENIEDVIWSEPDACPLCAWCASQSWAKEYGSESITVSMPQGEIVEVDAESPLTDDQMQWLLDGGTVALHGTTWVRKVPKKRPNQKEENVRKHEICDKCYEPDWLDSVFYEGKSEADGMEVYYCRWCHDKYIVNASEDEEDTREFHIRQDVDASPDMDDDDKDFFGSVRTEAAAPFLPPAGTINRLTNNTARPKWPTHLLPAPKPDDVIDPDDGSVG